MNIRDAGQDLTGEIVFFFQKIKNFSRFEAMYGNRANRK